MSINQVISSINVDSATDDGKVPTYDATTDTFLMETPGGGSGSMTLIGSGSGSVAYNSSSNLDTVAISGLTALDSIYVVYSFDAQSSGDDDGRWLLYSTTDTTIISRLDNNSNLGAQYINGSALVKQNAQFDTWYNTVYSVYIHNLTAGGTYGNAQGGLTAWTGSWTLALRHSAGGTGSGTAYWSWAVYKLAGQ